MNITTVKALRQSIEAALEPVAEQYGLAITLGRGKYTSTYAEIKLTAGEPNGNGVAASAEAEDFQKLAVVYGLAPDDLGKTVILKGKGSQLAKYRIIGLRARATKWSILLEAADPKDPKAHPQIAATPELVAKLLGRKPVSV